ncbi:MAG: T9SS type A sorting domain-containing protein [Bacteroidetes bacterium]|nr:T9SS type A sorting domain-containing protein [Bacteroidota bacterium]
MKNIYFLVFILIELHSSAQVSIVKDVTAAGIIPTSDKQEFWQNNKWNNKIYYNAGTSAKLAVTDGTDAGTFLVKDLAIAGASTTITKIIPAQDLFYIQIDVVDTWSPYTLHQELWRSDGTATGTFLLKKFDATTSYPINLGSDITEYYNNSISGNEMFFAAFTSANGYELWKSDGTVAGTTMVKDMNPGSGSTPMDGFTRMGNFVYFFTGSGQLWKTDGTDAGTTNIPLPSGLIVYVYNTMAEYNGKLFFIGFDAAHGNELWTSDGTTSGTYMVKDTSPRTDYYYTHKGFMLKKIPGGLIFQQNMVPSSNKVALWKTDGTAAGTIKLTDDEAIDEQMIRDISMTQESIYFHNMTQKNIVKSNYQPGGSSVVPFNPMLYFQAKNYFNFKNTLWLNCGWPAAGYDGPEPWRCDGNQASKALDINPGAAGSAPFGFFEKDDKMCFFANNGSGVKLFQFYGDYTFNNSVSNKWSNPSNWNSGILPMLTDNATIPSGYNVNIDTNAYANNLILNSPTQLASGNMNISGNLNLNAKLSLNNNNLILKGSSSLISNGNSSNYIETNGSGKVTVENMDANRGTLQLPIGTSSQYNPVSLKNIGSVDHFSVQVSDGISNTSNEAVNATWDISEATAGGSTLEIGLGWNQAQESAGFNRANAKVGHFVGGVWTEENSGSVSGSNPYFLIGTGITSLSPFSVMNFSSLATSEVNKKEILIYPNPIKDLLNIQVNEDCQMTIYDLSGKHISTEGLKKGMNTLDKSQLPKGVYELIIQGTKTLKSFKIIKN